MGRIVIACYRPKPGKRDALRRLIVDHVATLRGQKLVTERVPITMEAQDGTIVEVFEWASHAAIEAAHANPAVLAMWEAYAEVCDYVPLTSVPEAADLFAEFEPVAGVRHELPAKQAARAPAKVVPAKPPRQPPPRNEFGDPPDTLYAGGTPRFDETGTGRARPRGKRR
jgi:quinol monooxygenase YgiN